jgi:hypothetical protein
LEDLKIDSVYLEDNGIEDNGIKIMELKDKLKIIED